MTFDKLFKTFVVVVLTISVWMAWDFRQTGINGRYVYQFRADRAQDVLFDTQTGHLFYINVADFEKVSNTTPVTVEENPFTGQLISHWAWSK